MATQIGDPASQFRRRFQAGPCGCKLKKSNPWLVSSSQLYQQYPPAFLAVAITPILARVQASGVQKISNQSNPQTDGFLTQKTTCCYAVHGARPLQDASRTEELIFIGSLARQRAQMRLYMLLAHRGWYGSKKHWLMKD